MPREITFSIKKKDFTVTPVKIDRRRLYGWIDIIATDEKGHPCQLASTDETGKYIIPRGGSALAILNAAGEWIERSALKSVNFDGSPAKLVKSSFEAPVELKRTVSPTEYLEYNITDFYQLSGDVDALLKAVGMDIYLFDYAYLDGFITSPAFVFAADDTLFLLVGEKNKQQSFCYGDCDRLDDDLEDAVESDDDELDFSMLG